jgi:plasmid stabilization system protein ParE
MSVQHEYAVFVAPYAVTQIDAALDWWERNRPDAHKLLAQELDAALRLIEHAPQAGRRANSKLFRGVRQLLLSRTRYLLYYQLREREHEVWVVHFRHARRRPI